MPKLVFERTHFEVDVPEGGAVVDVCDAHVKAGVPFACRHANCGSCRVDVTEGLALCVSPEDDELDLLEGVFHDPPTVRLACQLRVIAGPGIVSLRVKR
jgi:ferredoxin